MKKQYLIYGGIAVGVLALIVLIAKNRKPKLTTASLVDKKIGEKFNKKNADYLAILNPDVRNTFVNFINDVQKMGYSVIITSSYRSTAEQVKQKKANSKAATPGFSAHEYGEAIDLNLVKDGKWINQNSSIAEWKKTGIIDLARNKYGMRWCGEACGYHDPVHFDLTTKYPTNKLYTIALKKYGSVDKIQGNKMTLTT